LPEKNNEYELIILENKIIEIFFTIIRYYIDVYLNKKFDNEKDLKKRIYLNNRFFIRRVFNILKFNIRLFKKKYFFKKKLKVEYYNRNYLINIFTKNTVILFLLFLIFINDFGVYRNIYKVLKAFY